MELVNHARTQLRDGVDLGDLRKLKETELSQTCSNNKTKGMV